MTIKELYEQAKEDGLENEQMFIWAKGEVFDWIEEEITGYEIIDNIVFLNYG